ncbi:MAG TPA: ATP-binding protein [Bryobacteraceae bacterium]
MKSVYLKILLWCFATLFISLFAFSMVSRFVETRAVGKGGPFARVDAMVLQQSIEAYESGGASKLATYLQTTAALPGQRFVTDPAGRDLATGADLSSLLNVVQGQWATPFRKGGQIVVVTPSAGGRYRLITVLDPPFGWWTLAPYYLLILAAVALVCWALALSIASPLRELARGVERFGGGELSVRLNSQRRDEIGELARSFDRMAERIGTLLTAERRLLQDVSHELRSPLARLSFAAELARRNENREAAIAQIKSEVQRLTELVASLLQLTRGEGDPLSLKQDRISISDVLSEIAADCRIEAEARGCRVALDCAEDGSVGIVAGDRELLRRAFENIVRNAIRYAPAGSKVDVKAESDSSGVRVSVRDYGVGVPEEFLEKLGQPFVRVDDSRDSSTGGVGLGLAIVKRAIGIHRGAFRLANVNPGLRVSVDLPLADSKPELPSHDRQETAVAQSHAER